MFHWALKYTPYCLVMKVLET